MALSGRRRWPPAACVLTQLRVVEGACAFWGLPLLRTFNLERRPEAGGRALRSRTATLALASNPCVCYFNHWKILLEYANEASTRSSRCAFGKFTPLGGKRARSFVCTNYIKYHHRRSVGGGCDRGRVERTRQIRQLHCTPRVLVGNAIGNHLVGTNQLVIVFAFTVNSSRRTVADS